MHTLKASFLQEAFWACFKKRPGVGYAWWPVEDRLLSSPEQRASCSVFFHALTGGFSLAYIPHGPLGFRQGDADGIDLQATIDTAPDNGSAEIANLRALCESWRPLIPRGCLAIRFDLPWHEREPAQDLVPDPALESAQHSTAAQPPMRPTLERPFVKAVDVQPPDTVVLDLRLDETALLAGMKPKWRYNIRLAAKKSVEVKVESWYPGSPAGTDRTAQEALDNAAIDCFYMLYQETARRDHISIHPRDYYFKLLRLSHGNLEGLAQEMALPDVRVWIARHEGEALAAIITLFYREQAVYLYGASSDNKRNLMPAYLLQWEAIRSAKAAGCTSYDFYGIPPTDGPGHPMAGLYRFKTGFGGTIRHYAGCWDYPLRPVLYRGYRFAEQLRQFWFKKIRKMGRRSG